jgi:hypothetical protein
MNWKQWLKELNCQIMYQHNMSQRQRFIETKDGNMIERFLVFRQCTTCGKILYNDTSYGKTVGEKK